MEWQFALMSMIGVVILLVLTGLPVAVVLLAVSIGFLIYALSPAQTASLLSEHILEFWTSWTIMAIPLFVLMGDFLVISGSAADIFNMASKWLSRLPGGLATVTVGTCAMFASMSGSSGAATATIGRIAIPEMMKRGYHARFATGCVTSGGTLAHLIPPSVLLLVYTSIVEISPGRALMAALIPGIGTAVLFTAVSTGWAIIKPSVAPREPPVSWGVRFSSLGTGWQPLVIIFAVMGTLYLGIATATEAAAIGAIAAVLVALAKRRLNWSSLGESLRSTARVSCFILLIAFAGKTLALTMTYYMIPQKVVALLMQAELNPWATMVMIMVMYIFMGMFLDPIGMMVVTLPVVMPVLQTLGFDLYWFGVMLMINFEIGLVSPPFGPQLYIVKGIVPDVPLKEILHGATIFLMAPALMMVILMFFPQLALWLPNMMSGG